MEQFDVKKVQNGNESFMVSFDFGKTPITQIADYIIIAASKHGTSDIHFDPREDGMMVRFRIDGDCQDYTFIPKAYERNLTTRLKLLASMNITESRLPQDGAIKGTFGDTYLDMRVSCLPLNEGEKIVIRILDYSRSLQGIESLDFDPRNLVKLKRMMGTPNGIILTTGATGSGKSTTTYSVLSALNKPETNIITVEDPIEMNIEGINQVQVNSEIGMTFAAALRSILRQDPDIILIGEIRDSETAQIAVRSAITGHLVVSTIHTNNALATIERLTDMDVERYLLSTALVGIISQRLAKRLCEDCRFQRETTPYEKKVFRTFMKKDVPTVWDANPKGCENCRKGYKGRIAIQEVLELDDEIRNSINNPKITKEELSEMVYTDKTISMLQDALTKCLAGWTSFEEVYRVIEIETDGEDDYGAELTKVIEDVEEQIEATEAAEKEDSDSLLGSTKGKPEGSIANQSFAAPPIELPTSEENGEEKKEEEGKEKKEETTTAPTTPETTTPTTTAPTEPPTVAPTTPVENKPDIPSLGGDIVHQASTSSAILVKNANMNGLEIAETNKREEATTNQPLEQTTQTPTQHQQTPVVPNTQAPVTQPQQAMPVVPNTQVPTAPITQTPTTVQPTQPVQQTPVVPNTQAPVVPNTQAPVQTTQPVPNTQPIEPLHDIVPDTIIKQQAVETTPVTVPPTTAAPQNTFIPSIAGTNNPTNEFTPNLNMSGTTLPPISPNGTQIQTHDAIIPSVIGGGTIERNVLTQQTNNSVIPNIVQTSTPPIAGSNSVISIGTNVVPNTIQK